MTTNCESCYRKNECQVRGTDRCRHPCPAFCGMIVTATLLPPPGRPMAAAKPQLMPCQHAFAESLRVIDYSSPFAPEYQCDCGIADVHMHFDGWPNNERLARELPTACEAHCKYLKGGTK